MAVKLYNLDDDITVSLYRRSGIKNINLKIDHEGLVKITMPYYMPYKIGIEYAKSHLTWIKTNIKPQSLILDNQLIGKAHHIKFVADSVITRPIGRLTKQGAIVTFPQAQELSSPEVQLVARSLALRVLRSQAEALLPIRLNELSNKYTLPYKTVSIKKLKSRWGSCDKESNIVLNLYLMQLPWECIDYVITHELTHTIVFDHGPKFWDAMASYLPNTPILRKLMHNYRTAL